MQNIGNPKKLAFIGFGEAAQAFLSGWPVEAQGRTSAYDIKSETEEGAAEMAERYARAGVSGEACSEDALRGAGVVFSTVTADQALVAAEVAAAGLAEGALWLDCNSCAPQTKRAAASKIEAACGRYVDVAVMAPVHPKRHLVPLLVSGPHAAAGIAELEALGMQPRFAGDEVGQASSIKMLRSVMIKGMEALHAECFLAARRAGVEEAVIGSLEVSDGNVPWRTRGAYSLERMMVHGGRRAAEMREVALTVEALGLGGEMARATALWQDRIAELGVDPGEVELMPRLDRLLAKL